MNGDWEKRIAITEEHYESIKEALEKHLKDSSSIRQDMNEIKMALIGSKKLELKGLAVRVSDVEKYQQEDKIRRAKRTGAVAVIMFLWGALITAFTLFKEKIFGV